jgi:hypothetical protein
MPVGNRDRRERFGVAPTPKELQIMLRKPAILAVWALVGTLGALGRVQADPIYQFQATLLGPGTAAAFNDLGDVVLNQDGRVYVWNSSLATRVDLGAGQGIAINNAGQVLIQTTGAETSRVVQWQTNTVNQTYDFQGTSLNDFGDVVGYNPSNPLSAYVQWAGESVATDLTTLGWAPGSHLSWNLRPVSINNNGTISGTYLGTAGVGSNGAHSFLTHLDANGNLQPLSGYPTPAYSSDMNNLGEGVGDVLGFVYRQTFGTGYLSTVPGLSILQGRVRDDSVLPPSYVGGGYLIGMNNLGLSINDSNQILAYENVTLTTDYLDPSLGTIWNVSGLKYFDGVTTYYLRDFVGSSISPLIDLEGGFSLNNSNQILGYNRTNGQGWLLSWSPYQAPTAVPEPSTLALTVMAGPVALLAWRRRKASRPE